MSTIRKVTTDSQAIDITCLNDVKDYCGIESCDDDPLIDDLIEAAVDYIERETSRSFLDRTYDEVFPSFPSYGGKLYLTHTPLKAITSITYYDINGDQQTLAPEDYILIQSDEIRSFIEPLPYTHWVATQRRSNAVTIRYTTGYTSYSPTLKRLIKAVVLTWNENRELEITGTITTTMKFAEAQRCLDLLSVGSVPL